MLKADAPKVAARELHVALPSPQKVDLISNEPKASAVAELYISKKFAPAARAFVGEELL